MRTSFNQNLRWAGLLLVLLACGAGREYSQAQNAPPQAPIVEAIGKNDLKAVEEILAADKTQANLITRYNMPVLVLAVQSGNAAMVKLLLDNGADPNADYNGDPVLQKALNNSNKTELLALLIDKGAKLDTFDREGYSPLTRAMSSSNRGAVEVLIEKGADINAPDERARVPFLLALQNGNPEVLKLAFTKKTDMSVTDGAGNSALHLLTQRGSVEGIKLALENGAPVDARNADGETALHIASQKPTDAMDVLLRAGASASLKNTRGDAPLHIAVRAGDPNGDAVIPAVNPYNPQMASASSSELRADGRLALLTEKTDINLKDGLGFSPLLLAISARDLEVRDMIMERAPKLDSTTLLFDAVSQGDATTVSKLLAAKPFLVFFRLPNGMTPLHVASLWGTRAVAELLMSKGGDANARDSFGRSPLYLATTRGVGVFARRRAAMMQLLFDKGADANAADRAGITPLARAARWGDAELATVMLQHKADVNARDALGVTPLLAAVSTPGPDTAGVVALLLKAGADPNIADKTNTTPLVRAAMMRKKDLVVTLLDKGANATQRTADGQSVLSRTLENSYGDNTDARDIAELLLDKGADPNEKRYGQTLLTRAISQSNLGLFKLLIAKKADINAKTENGTTLHAAIGNNNKEAAAILLEAGAAVNARNQSGQTPLMMARQYKRPEIIEMLLAKGAKEDATPAPAFKTGGGGTPF